jgi:hypothetical protein
VFPPKLTNTAGWCWPSRTVSMSHGSHDGTEHGAIMKREGGGRIYIVVEHSRPTGVRRARGPRVPLLTTSNKA